jgi:predicted nucleic acid-binding protein
MERRAFFDTNILIYAHTKSGAKSERAREVLSFGGVVSVQVLNETANVLRRRFALSWPHISKVIESVLDTCPDPRPLTIETNRAALRISERYGFAFYDGLILAAAAEIQCTVLYTEDLQHGQMIDGLRIENPFKA